MYGGYIASGSAVSFSLSRAITRMAADQQERWSGGRIGEAARTTKYYFIKIHCKSVVFIIILCSLFISICCTYIDTNFDSQNVYYIYLATYLFWH